MEYQFEFALPPNVRPVDAIKLFNTIMSEYDQMLYSHGSPRQAKPLKQEEFASLWRVSDPTQKRPIFIRAFVTSDRLWLRVQAYDDLGESGFAAQWGPVYEWITEKGRWSEVKAKLPAAPAPEAAAQAEAQLAGNRRGQAWAKGKITDEVRERANHTRPLHEAHPEWSCQNIADHLMKTLLDTELAKLKRGFNCQNNPLMGEDIENAWARMGQVEGYAKWPKWGTGKITLR